MSEITESAIELFAIEQFEQLGYQCVYGPSIAPDSEKPEIDCCRVETINLPTGK